MSQWWEENAEPEPQPLRLPGEKHSDYMLRLMAWQGVDRRTIEALRPVTAEREPGAEG